MSFNAIPFAVNVFAVIFIAEYTRGKVHNFSQKNLNLIIFDEKFSFSSQRLESYYCNDVHIVWDQVWACGVDGDADFEAYKLRFVVPSSLVMAQNNKSFRHLFSFGGTTPAKQEPAKPEVLEPTEQETFLPSTVQSYTEPKKPRNDDLSDPEDCPKDILKKAQNFCRGDKDLDSLRNEWFEEGRQDRLRLDFKMNRRRRAKGRQLGSKQSNSPD